SISHEVTSAPCAAATRRERSQGSPAENPARVSAAASAAASAMPEARWLSAAAAPTPTSPIAAMPTAQTMPAVAIEAPMSETPVEGAALGPDRHREHGDAYLRARGHAHKIAVGSDRRTRARYRRSHDAGGAGRLAASREPGRVCGGVLQPHLH